MKIYQNFQICYIYIYQLATLFINDLECYPRCDWLKTSY